MSFSLSKTGSNPKAFHIGIVGHRYLENTETIVFVASSCFAILSQLQSEHKNITAFSALAEGADTLFAEAAVALNIPLQIVRPFEKYELDFTSPSAKQQYERLRSLACSETKLEYQNRSDAAYLAGMHWIVDNCNLLVAAWDGSPAKGTGGTGDAIEKAVLMHCDWIHLNVADLSVTWHVAREKRD